MAADARRDADATDRCERVSVGFTTLLTSQPVRLSIIAVSQLLRLHRATSSRLASRRVLPAAAARRRA